MKRFLAIVTIIVLVGSSSAYAEDWRRMHGSNFPLLSQTLPGPAGGGWFVLIGKTQDIDRDLGRDYYCQARVYADSDSSRSWFWGGVYRVVVTKRFGPYPNRDMAVQQLGNAGWGVNERDGSFWAATGC